MVHLVMHGGDDAFGDGDAFVDGDIDAFGGGRGQGRDAFGDAW